MPDNRETIYSRLKLINSKDKALDVLLLVEKFKSNGNSFLFSFCWAGLSAAFLIQKALKAIKLI